MRKIKEALTFHHRLLVLKYESQMIRKFFISKLIFFIFPHYTISLISFSFRSDKKFYTTRFLTTIDNDSYYYHLSTSNTHFLNVITNPIRQYICNYKGICKNHTNKSTDSNGNAVNTYINMRRICWPRTWPNTVAICPIHIPRTYICKLCR